MDIATKLFIVFTIVAFIVGLALWLTKITVAGGSFHGRWLDDHPHDCLHPYYYEGELGNTWQCRWCKQIWIRNKYVWERMK